MRRISAPIVAALVVLLNLVVPGVQAQSAVIVPARASAQPAADTLCAGIPQWGSGAKQFQGASTQRTIQKVRVAVHAKCERLVFDIPGATKKIGFRIGYVTRAYSDPRGQYIYLGRTYGAYNKILQLTIKARSGWKAGKILFPITPQLNTGLRTRVIKAGGSSEGLSTIYAGVYGKLPFLAFSYVETTAQGKSIGHVVVDIARQWPAQP